MPMRICLRLLFFIFFLIGQQGTYKPGLVTRAQCVLNILSSVNYLPSDQGFLKLQGLVPDYVLQGWREQFWSTIKADPEDPETWPGLLASSVLGSHAQAS